jgi:hypothetical protein
MVSIWMSPELLEQAEIRTNTRQAMVGGSTGLPMGRDERLEKLEMHQLTGLVCHAAGSLIVTKSLEAYHEQRATANASPTKGDGGSDIPGYLLDIKGSLMRYGKDPSRYNLAVPVRERHRDMLYLLALMDAENGGWRVYFPGWAAEAELPGRVGTDPRFPRSFVLPNSKLHPLPVPLKIDPLYQGPSRPRELVPA